MASPTLFLGVRRLSILIRQDLLNDLLAHAKARSETPEVPSFADWQETSAAKKLIAEASKQYAVLKANVPKTLALRLYRKQFGSKADKVRGRPSHTVLYEIIDEGMAQWLKNQKETTRGATKRINAKR